MTYNHDKTTLARRLSFPLLVFYGLGTVLGAGIYVLIGEVAAKAGIYAPLSFIIAVIVVAFTGISYAELSARYPKSAGEAYYVHRAFHFKVLSGLVGWGVVLTGLVSAATLARGFIGYFYIFFIVPEILLISVLVLTLGLVAIWGIYQSVWIATVITLIEIFGLCLVIFVARDSLLLLPERTEIFLPPAESAIWAGILYGAFIAFYAFIGFEDMVNVAEEVKNPQKNLPLAIFIVIISSTILYFLIAIIAVLSLPLNELQGQSAPLAAVVAQKDFPKELISLISLVAIINGLLIQIIMASRVIYGMAHQKLAPRLLGHVLARTQTPIYATLLITVIILILALWLPLVTLAQMTSFIILCIFSLVNAALIKVKMTTSVPKGVRTYPIILPIIGMVFCLSFIGFQFV